MHLNATEFSTTSETRAAPAKTDLKYMGVRCSVHASGGHRHTGKTDGGSSPAAGTKPEQNAASPGGHCIVLFSVRRIEKGVDLA